MRVAERWTQTERMVTGEEYNILLTEFDFKKPELPFYMQQRNRHEKRAFKKKGRR